MKNFYKILLIIFCAFMTFEKSYAEEKQKMDSGHKYNIYTGMFDFSDKGKKSSNFRNSTFKRQSFQRKLFRHI